jgi:hypothetical protein
MAFYTVLDSTIWLRKVFAFFECLNRFIKDKLSDECLQAKATKLAEDKNNLLLSVQELQNTVTELEVAI